MITKYRPPRGMWMVGFAVLVLLLSTAGGRASGGVVTVRDGVPHVLNEAQPAEGAQSLRLEEQWRVGADEDDILLGVVSAVVAGEDGSLYLLDRQLCQVHVFSSDGVYQRSLSRRGEGPGELGDPVALSFMPDGSLGIAQARPGKIVKLALDGTPRGSLLPGGEQASTMGFHGIEGVAYRGNVLAICGTTMSPGEDGFTRTNYLGVYAEDGTERARILEKSRQGAFGDRRFVEKDNYFVDRGRWALSPDGRLYTADERDRYAIHVYAPDGRLERVFERPYQPWKRNQEEKDEIGGRVVMVINGERVKIESVVEDHDPCISAIEIMDNGDVWVAHSRSARELPAGTFATYDVFSPEGHFLRQVAIMGDYNSEGDRLFLLGDGHAVMVTGFRDAFSSFFARGGDEEKEEETEEPAPMEVIFCTVTG